jgi:hypothetical protein
MRFAVLACDLLILRRAVSENSLADREDEMIAGVSANSLYNPAIMNRMQQVQQDFQQMGMDLQSGNLSAAQTDFASLQQIDPQAGPVSSTQGNPIAQGFSQLSQDLGAGNLASAQADFTTLQQDFASRVGMWQRHHHGDAGSAQSSLGQEFSQLIEMLQSGNQSGAQQIYDSLQQELQQFAQSSGLTNATGTSPASGEVSLSG